MEDAYPGAREHGDDGPKANLDRRESEWTPRVSVNDG